MALTLMPDGKTFKKLNAVQEKALKRYYNRLHDKPLAETLGLPIGLAVLGGIGAIAYIFKDELQQYLKDKEEDVVDWIKGLPVAAGGGVADIVVSLIDAVGLSTNEPVNPEYVMLDPIPAERSASGEIEERRLGPFTRCQRWEFDANDWVSNVEAGKFLTKIGAALAGNYIIKNMKKEGCSRPQAFTQAQWDDI